MKGMELGSLLEEEKRLNQLLNNPVKPQVFIENNEDIHAYRFLKKLNLLDRRFIEKEEAVSDRFPWLKAYKDFHYSIKAKRNESAETLFDEWKRNLPEQIFHADFEQKPLIISDKKLEAIRGFQWLLAMNDLQHIQSCHQSFRSLFPGEYQLEFGISRYLWRITRKGKQVEVFLNHTLLSASVDDLMEMIHLILDKKNHEAKAFTETRYYQQRDRFLKSRLNSQSSGSGVFVDLEEIVQGTIQRYFPAMNTLPSITWSGRFSVRKLAHYSESKDEIAFSLIFDQPGLDSGMLEYLAYHELLHRDIGTVKTKGKRYAHTPEFKRREKMYPGFKRWEEMLHKFAQYGKKD